MQTTSSTMDAALNAHTNAGGSFYLIDLVEIYASDYTIPATGFDPAHAEARFCGVEGFTFLGLAYVREYIDRSDVVKQIGQEPNTCSANFSNISRTLANYVIENDIEGKWLVVRSKARFNTPRENGGKVSALSLA